MISFTGSKLRWVTADGLRYECTENGSCRVGAAGSILGNALEDFGRDRSNPGGARLRRRPHHWTVGSPPAKGRALQFASGELRSLPEKVTNRWERPARSAPST